MSDQEENGSQWRWDHRPDRMDPEEIVRSVERRRNLIAWVFVIVVPLIATGQKLLAALAGLGVMGFSEAVLVILTGSVPIEVLLTLRMVVRRVL